MTITDTRLLTVHKYIYIHTCSMLLSNQLFELTQSRMGEGNNGVVVGC